MFQTKDMHLLHAFFLLASLRLQNVVGRHVPKDLTKAGALIAGFVASSLIGYQLYTGPQYENANMIPSQVLSNKKELYGKIVYITDGDTYSFRHLPSIFSSETYRGNKKQNTITVRIIAVDTPEIGKGGKLGQEYSEEARDFAENKLLGKAVRIRCLARDQYGRLLGRVFYKESNFLSLLWSSSRDISEELLQRGLAVVYRGGGAKYDGSIQSWEKLESEARAKKIGLWSNKKVVLPSEYKKQNKVRKSSRSRSQ